MKKFNYGAVVGLGLLAVATFSRAEDALAPVSLNISSQSMEDALNAFAQQARLQLLFQSRVALDQKAPPVVGTLTPREGLERLLANSGLRYEFINARTVTIRAVKADDSKGEGEPSAAEKGAPSDALMLAQAEEGQVEPREKQEAEGVQLEEVVVTGSHIRGGRSASPTISYDRAAIERTGFSTTQQLIQSLPQNYNNISESTFGTVNGGGDGTLAQASAINLRGLGGASTLVLLNGRRLVSSGDGSFVDISLIPLSAIERIDVMTDGASAIYGSDAIGGVVNIILRDRYDGAETAARYTTVTSGDSREIQVSQTLGKDWGSGSGLLSYEYLHRTPLNSSDRDFTQDAPGFLDLVPKQVRHSVIGAIRHNLGTEMAVHGEFFFGKRDADVSYTVLGPVVDLSAMTDQYNGTFGIDIGMGAGWQLRANGVFGTSHTEQKSFEEGGDPSIFEYASQVWSADMAADGPIGRIGGGDVRLAVGAQFRKEELEPKAFTGIMANNTLRRDISIAYAEMLAPLVGIANRRRGIERLELTAAGRFERYSDFGSTTNPKFGVIWSPLSGIDLRATYGTSFRAPLLSQVNPVNLLAVAFDMPDPGAPGDATPSILLFGSGTDLGPEEAETRTVGIDFKPDWASGLGISATWFDVQFTERVTSPIPDDDRLFTALFEPTYASFVDRAPDSSTVSDLFSDPRFFNFSSATAPGQIGAIIDNRLINLVEQTLSGVDLSVSYPFAAHATNFLWQTSAEYLFNGKRRILPGTPEIDTLNSVFLPVDLRLRTGISWNRGAFTSTGFVNYTDGYEDNRIPGNAGPNQRSDVASWTTVDLTFQYDPAPDQSEGWLNGLHLTVSAINLFDRDPPFISSLLNINFDGANASPMGRTVGFMVRKRW